jgi:hypothetical protein
MKSCVLILPAALRAKGNALGEALGHGPNSYSVPLSATGSEPATHYGLHTWADQAFLALLSDPHVPDGVDYPQADLDAVAGSLVASVRDDVQGHFAEVVAGDGLAVVNLA